MRKFIVTLAVLVWTVTVLPAQQSAPRRFGLDDFSRVARVADPQIAPDGKSVAVVISRANLDEDRYDPDLVLVDVASATPRTLVTGKPGLASPRWAPDGQRLAFLVTTGTGSTAHLQVAVVSTSGGDPQILTSAPRAVQQFTWSPDSKTIAYATQDEPEKKPGFERFNDSFEVTLNTDFTMTAPVPPTHVWTVPASGGEAKRLTSGSWSLPISHPPGPPASAIAWTRDGSAIAFSRTGGGAAGGGRGAGAGVPIANGVQVVNVSDGSIAPLVNVGGTFPQFAPSGEAVVFMAGGNVSVVPAPGAVARSLTQPIDRNMARALWLPDGKSLVVGANDSTRVSLWVQPVEGSARKLESRRPQPEFVVLRGHERGA